VAIKGNGFFQVTMPDGTNGYTRDGSFQVDAQGRWSPPPACRWPTA
jgi:flagellar basal-body rod protein FlgG